MPPPVPDVVTLYGKPGCCLCEEARAELIALQVELGFELAEIDVSVDPRLNGAYGERVPVVAVGGADLSEFTVDPEGLRRALGRVGRP